MFTPPIPQDPDYHLFTDSRAIFGVPNAWNVLSNVPFLIFGVWGLAHVLRQDVGRQDLKPAFAVFFAGILLTAFGSGYYHLAPNNDSLIYDRLPMTVGFAGFFSIVIGEFVSVRLARRLLLPFLFIGIASVGYWACTEARGMGDLRPYAVVQFLPMLLIPGILLVYRTASRMGRYFWLMILVYLLAKLAEFFDASLYASSQLLSGHTLKHLLAATAPAILLYALSRPQEIRSNEYSDL